MDSSNDFVFHNILVTAEVLYNVQRQIYMDEEKSLNTTVIDKCREGVGGCKKRLRFPTTNVVAVPSSSPP